MGRVNSFDDAVSLIEPGMNVFIHGGSATSTPMIEALTRRQNLHGVKLYHLHLAGPVGFADPAYKGGVTSCSMFVGQNLRDAVREGRAEYIPVFLSDISGLFRAGRIRLDAAIVQLSPPDRHGLCSLGISVDVARAAVDTAGLVIADVNKQMPRTHGNTVVPQSKLAAWVESDRPLHEHHPEPKAEVTERIGEIVAGLIEDGSTLQMGIGAVPDAVLARLANKHELGIHTEMFSDGVVDLVKGGVITNRTKGVHPGRSVTSFVIGTQRLFDFVNDNPLVEFHPADRTNDTSLIRRNDRTIAINSALQVDLTGQVCADSLGHNIYSGIGGQMDFIRGAALSRGGKAIIALPATAAGGRLSRIATELTPGAGVVTTRGHVHWIVTEYGAVDLHGRSLRERGEALVSIAHPDFRAELRRSLANVRHYILG
ncbi:MAG: acetyl-CoA hydrolase/transferase family protein [Phycisphaerae bacterium]|nr:acetyl-CoA hydrolase/transferase family protein [Phycisphaerae bacterium]